MKVTLCVVLLALLTLGFVHYRAETEADRLFAAYFTAEPPAGYGTTRALATPTTENSIYRQAVSYHQRARYDYALTAWTAYLETDPRPEDYRPRLLAATAALASGRYAEGEVLLNDMPRETETARANYVWYAALLALKRKEYTEAERLLKTFPPAEATVAWREKLTRLREELGRLSGNGGDALHEGQ